MDNSQVNAAKLLLNKVLPDLSAVSLSGPDGGPAAFIIRDLTKSE